MYKTILFDLDGTLTDSGIGITNSVAYSLKKFGIEAKSREELFRFVGPPLLDAFSEYYGFSKEESEKALAFYREYFSEKGIFENIVYNGVEDMLKKLKEMGKDILLATAKPEQFAIRILKHFGLFDYFDFIAGATMDESRNQKDAVIKYAIDSFGIRDAQTAVMVGDRHHDILGAKKFSIDSIGVLYGYGSKDELTKAGATYIAENVDDILKFV